MVSTTISLDNKTPAIAAASTFESNAAAANSTITSHHHQRTSSTIANQAGKTSHGLTASSSALGHLQNYHQSTRLSRSASGTKFDSASSSLNEKISILFPKCRPKSEAVQSGTSSIATPATATAATTSSRPNGTLTRSGPSMHSTNSHHATARDISSSSNLTPTSPSTTTSPANFSAHSTNQLNNNHHYTSATSNNNHHQSMHAPNAMENHQQDVNAATTAASDPSQTTINHKSPNISTNPFLSRHPNEKVSYYYKSSAMNNDSEHYTTLAGFQPNSAVPTYTQKLLTQKHQQQQQAEHQSLGYQASQNPFMSNHKQDTNAPSSHQWEPRKRATANTTPSSTVLNSPDLIESTDPRLNQNNGSSGRDNGYQHHKMAPLHHIRVGRSPVNSQQQHQFYQTQQQQQYQQHQQQQQHQPQQQLSHHHHSYTSYMGNDRFPTLSPSPSSLVAGAGLGNDEDDDHEDGPGEEAPDGIVASSSAASNAADDGLDVRTPSKMAVVADGEVVVFDDIGDNWQNLRIATESPPQPKQPPPPPPHHNHHKNRDPEEEDEDDDRHRNYHHHHTERPVEYKTYRNAGASSRSKVLSRHQASEYLEPHNNSSSVSSTSCGGGAVGFISNASRVSPSNSTGGDSLKGIAGIMEYDGSPRRFGQIQQPATSDASSSGLMYSSLATPSSKVSSSLFSSPRPGFPQRVVLSTNDATTAPTMSATPSVAAVNTDDTSNDISDMATSSDVTLSDAQSASAVRNSTFDYLYEFSETRKVLEEFFKCPASEDKVLDNGSDVDSIDIHYEFKGNHGENQDFAKYIGQRLASSPYEEYNNTEAGSPSPSKMNGCYGKPSMELTEEDVNKDVDYFLDSASRSSGGEALDNDMKMMGTRSDSRCFRYSPETTDYDSNCGDLDSLSGDFNVSNSYPTNYSKYYASMPILEDGLSSGHASDTENNNPTGISLVMDMRGGEPMQRRGSNGAGDNDVAYGSDINNGSSQRGGGCGGGGGGAGDHHPNKYGNDDLMSEEELRELNRAHLEEQENVLQSPKNKIFKNIDPELDSLYSINMVQLTPPPPAPAPHRKPSLISCSSSDVQSTLKDIKNTLERTKALTGSLSEDKPRMDNHKLSSPTICSPVWIPRHFDNSGESLESEPALKNMSGDEEEVDTDLETDRLLGHQRLEDHGFYDEKNWCDRKPRSLLSASLSKFSPKTQNLAPPNPAQGAGSTSIIRQGLSALLPTTPEIVLQQAPVSNSNNSIPTTVSAAAPISNMTTSSTSKLLDIGGSMSSPEHSDKSPINTIEMQMSNESPTGSNGSNKQDLDKKKKSKNKEVLIEGVLFRARYLGSTQLVCEGQPTKSTRMVQAEEAVSRIKAPDGEVQPSTEVDLFISTEKIMVLNTDLKEIMMDHALRTISYIADIGDLVVLMARRRFVPNEIDDAPKPNRTPKMICHVFESDEAQFIAQSIGQAFQVAYMEFLKANGIEDHSFVKEMDYQEVLNSQEIFGDELEIFAKKELQKEVVVPKAKGEILGVVIVESGWGSMLPTVVIANLLSSGAAARCGQLNIGDQIIAINGMSLVGLPLSTCQTYIKNTKTQTVVKFTVVPCAPVVEVKIKRPNTKYQLGFSVQNGVICSLLRGGIAERGGVRVGHRIIEINNQSVVAVPHEKIVNLLATSVGEILMKTMPTSMFRLLTGQENPVYI